MLGQNTQHPKIKRYGHCYGQLLIGSKAEWHVWKAWQGQLLMSWKALIREKKEELVRVIYIYIIVIDISRHASTSWQQLNSVTPQFTVQSPSKIPVYEHMTTREDLLLYLNHNINSLFGAIFKWRGQNTNFYISTSLWLSRSSFLYINFFWSWM